MSKKALIFLIVAAATVLPAVADAPVVSGDVYAGFINDFAGTTGYYGYTNLYVKAKVSDFIDTYYRLYYYMGYLGLNGNTTAAVSATSWITMPTMMAYGKLDLTKALGVDTKTFGMTFEAGNYSASDNGYSNMTADSYEDVSAAGVGTDWYMASTATILGQIYLKGGVAPRTDGDWFAGIYATPNLGFGTLKAEAFFDGNKHADGMGVISTDARLEVPLAKNALWVGGGFKYDLNASTYKWAGSAKFLLGSLLNVAASVWGTDAAALDGAGATLYVTPIVKANDNVSVDICSNVKLSFSAENLLQGWDNAFRVNIGTADLYLGYVLTSVGAGAYWGKNIVNDLGGTTTSASQDGGLYVRLYAPF